MQDQLIPKLCYKNAKGYKLSAEDTDKICVREYKPVRHEHSLFHFSVNSFSSF